MIMNREVVNKLFGISKLDTNLRDNIFELLELSLVSENYDVLTICKIYTEAEAFYHEYLPEYIVESILEVKIDNLFNMKLSYIPMPTEFQYLFYDKYPEGVFKLSKYAFYSADVYKLLAKLSKTIFLQLPFNLTLPYKSYFITAGNAANILGFLKENRDLYHIYLLDLDVRFIEHDNRMLYLIDDVNRACNKAHEIFDQYISFNEACEQYGTHIMTYLVNEHNLQTVIYDFIPFDVVFSDRRYINNYNQSTCFINKENLNYYYKLWFLKSAGEIYSFTKPEFIGNKFNCYPGTFEDEDYDTFASKKDLSVFTQKSYLRNYPSKYFFNTNDYEHYYLLCSIWGVNDIMYSSNFLSLIKRKVNNFVKDEFYYFDVDGFKNQFKESIFHSTFNFLNNKNCFDGAQGVVRHFISCNLNIELDMSPVVINESSYYPEFIMKFWYYFNSTEKYRSYSSKELNNKVYRSYDEHKRYCINVFYTNRFFNLFSLGSNQLLASRYLNTNHTVEKIPNIQRLINDDFNIALKLTNCSMNSIKIKVNDKLGLSNLIYTSDLGKKQNLIGLSSLLNILNLRNYSISELWIIIYNLGITIYQNESGTYFINDEISTLKNYIEKLISSYIPAKILYELLHFSSEAIQIDDIIAIPMPLYFLLPESYRGFYWVKNIPYDILNTTYNKHINEVTLMTLAEEKKDLNLLPPNINKHLAMILLDISPQSFSKFSKDYKLYVNYSSIFCYRDKVLDIKHLQDSFIKTYIPYDNIITFLELEITTLSSKDHELLDTISCIPIPDYIIVMKRFRDIATFKAYKKDDLIQLKPLIHVDNRVKLDISINYNLYGDTPFNTYLIRSKDQFDESSISESSKCYWNDFIKFKIVRFQGNEKVLQDNINKYVKAYYLLLNLLKNYEITNIHEIKTGMINRWFDNINSRTYSLILFSFFKYCYIEYCNIGILPLFQVKNIILPKKVPYVLDSYLPHIYSFTEFNIIFQYCNNYYLHVNTAITEIIDLKTCVYASTWFYTMSHLNNEWRSNDFAHFPYVEISDVIQRNKISNIEWFTNNKLPKNECLLIFLRVQNSPKIISKTKKFTRFTCSDQLLETYITLYTLLALYTSKLNYNPGYITHFNNKYNALSKAQLDNFFISVGIINFKFKSRKMNKTLMSMIDFMEDFYINNEIDSKRKHAMLLRSHVSIESTAHYIKENQHAFDTISNMICARGEFGYAYDMMVKATLPNGKEFSSYELTDEIRKIRQLIPNIKSLDTLYGFLNYSQKDYDQINGYINTLTLQELQIKLTKLFLNHLGSKSSNYIPCIKDVCNNKSTDRESCFYCIFHIPTIYSLSLICNSIKNDIKEYSTSNSSMTKGKLVNKITKKSRDIIWANKIYGNDIIKEILSLTDNEFVNFIDTMKQFHINKI